MRPGAKPPSRSTAKNRNKAIWERAKTDGDVLDALRFLKKLLIGVVKMIVAVGFLGVGALCIALVIHLVFTALEAQKIELPDWTRKAEVQGTGLVIASLVLLGVAVAVKDAWRVGAQSEVAEEPETEEPETN